MTDHFFCCFSQAAIAKVFQSASFEVEGKEQCRIAVFPTTGFAQCSPWTWVCLCSAREYTPALFTGPVGRK
jgi:hypothetical protein